MEDLIKDLKRLINEIESQPTITDWQRGRLSAFKGVLARLTENK